jgi:DNA/RNA-binding domain of Phe-tRNA-synthetase-like protein
MRRWKYKQSIKTKVRKETRLTRYTVMAVPALLPVYETETWINKNKKVSKMQAD